MGKSRKFRDEDASAKVEAKFAPQPIRTTPLRTFEVEERWEELLPQLDSLA